MNGEDSPAGNTDQGLNVTPEVDSTPLQHVLARPPRIALALLLGGTALPLIRTKAQRFSYEEGRTASAVILCTWVSRWSYSS